MNNQEGVPPWARPVLEELRGFADAAWRGLASQDRVTAAWAGAMRDAITAALAADAGTPVGERAAWEARTHHEPSEAALAAASAKFARPDPWPHICNHRALHQAVIAAYAVDFPALSTAPTPSAAPETSTSLVDAAPDAELDRLISEYGRAHARAVELLSWPNDTLQCRATIHAHVEKVKREARAAGERAATGEVVGTAELYDSHVGHLQETHPYPRDAMIPVDLVRRRGKEEG